MSAHNIMKDFLSPSFSPLKSNWHSLHFQIQHGDLWHNIEELMLLFLFKYILHTDSWALLNEMSTTSLVVESDLE